jgi:hypothetical protein
MLGLFDRSAGLVVGRGVGRRALDRLDAVLDAGLGLVGLAGSDDLAVSGCHPESTDSTYASADERAATRRLAPSSHSVVAVIGVKLLRF